MIQKKKPQIICFLILVFIYQVSAQTKRFYPDSVSAETVWKIDRANTALYVGASFNYINPEDSIVVWLDTSESAADGKLYCLVPGYSDSAYFLFSNRDYSGRVNITRALPSVIKPGTEIFFAYKRDNSPYKRYTGQNRPGIDPVDTINYPDSAEFVSTEYGMRPGFGYRWAVAGRLDYGDGVRNDTLVFGFEDDAIIIPDNDTVKIAADFDFNDIVFRVTGLALNVEAIPDSLELTASKTTVSAGDSVYLNAKIWADSNGVKVRAPSFDSLVKWELTGDRVNNDILQMGDGPSGSNVFIARSAWKDFKISAVFVNKVTKDTMRSDVQIHVIPGQVAQLSIELKADTASIGFNRNNSIQIARTQILSNQTSTSIYAILRDAFGNFVDFSKHTVWDTVFINGQKYDNGTVELKNGNVKIGEGIVKRRNSAGTSAVSACDTFYKNIALKDTTIVQVLSGSYDSLRIVSVSEFDTVYHTNYSMTTDSCMHFVAQGFRADIRKWEVIRVTWGSEKWTIPVVQAETFEFCPEDTGSGKLSINYAGILNSGVVLKVNPGVPVSVVLYSDDNKKLSDSITVTAGEIIKLTALLFDKHGIAVSSENIPFEWCVLENSTLFSGSDSTGIIRFSQSYKADYQPFRAHRTVSIRVTARSMQDSVLLTVKPGKPYRVVIESHANWMLSANKSAEVDTIEIPDNQTKAVVYGMLRDSLDNFIDTARVCSWKSLDTVTEVNTGRFAGEGSITKNVSLKSGYSRITLTDSVHKFIDSAVVKILPYHYIGIRIVTGNIVPDSLVMSTNDDTTLFAEGLRSDTALWRPVSVDWSISENLRVAPLPGAKVAKYLFSPVIPGRGNIVVVSNSLKDTLPVVFTRGEPVRIDISFLTPPEKMIAGDTISALVKIYNKDGLVPGSYCFDLEGKSSGVYLQDIIGRNMKYTPFSIVEKKKTLLNYYPDKSTRFSECFQDGSDTIGIVLFYAPYNGDSLHKLTITADSLVAFTPFFSIKPASLYDLNIDHTGKEENDTLVLQAPVDEALVYTSGFDKYGNYCGEVRALWNSTGAIKKIESSKPVSRILYSIDSTIGKYDKRGYILAVAYSDAKLSDSLPVHIKGPLANLIKAKTADIDGNGYIDRITLTFDKEIIINGKKTTSYIIKYLGSVFTVDSIYGSSDQKNLTFVLKENISGPAQTDWTPLVIINNKNRDLNGIGDTLVCTAEDGAGPVIVAVTRAIKTWSNDHTKDNVTVQFSEPLIDSKGNRLSFIAPDKVFLTWFLMEKGNYNKVSLLDGISSVFPTVNDTSMSFLMSNNKELTTNNFFSFSSDTNGFSFSDISGNRPNKNNRKVQVVVSGDPQQIIKIAPNPGSPSVSREGPGVFNFKHNSVALEWVNKDKKGFVITFPFKFPEGKNVSIGGRISIMDMMGNIVTQAPRTEHQWKGLVTDEPVIVNEFTPSVIPLTWKNDGTVHEFSIYWNGYTPDKRRVAPGVYMVDVALIIEVDGKKDVLVMRKKIGVKL